MPTPNPHPELDVCIEAASRITASAIESGKLLPNIEDVKKYFSDIYAYMLKVKFSR